ncbi:MAG: beta-lactamase family protein [Fibrobacterales bacterium]
MYQSLLNLFFLLGLSGAFYGCSFDPAPKLVQCTQSYEYGQGYFATPPELWSTDFSQSISGELPALLQTKLEVIVDSILRKTPAVSIAIGIPGVGRWSIHKGLTISTGTDSVLPHQQFQAGSITKLFVSTVMQQLIEEGKVSLSDTLAQWYPEVPFSNYISIQQLLRNTTGLNNFNDLPSMTPTYRSPDSIIATITENDFYFCPGRSGLYSNTGYLILGRLIEHIEQKSLHAVFQEKIVQNISLEHTALRHKGDTIQVVGGHSNGRTEFVQDNYATPFSAGSLSSQAHDLVTFMHSFMSGALLKTTTVHSMLTNLTSMPQYGPVFYGAGIQAYSILGGPGYMVGHSGGIPGFNAILVYVVQDNIFISVMHNDKEIPVEVSLWDIVKAVREYREN